MTFDNQYERGLFTLKNMGESDLSDLLQLAKSKLDTLTDEPKIKVFFIKGFYQNRYTESHEAAKEILKEEFNLMLEQVEEDYADSKMDIQMKNIKQSNLKDYKIE
jgi:hypothetical protein